MADWGVLGLSGDPVPGSVTGVRGLSSRLGGYADTAGTNRDRLRSVASDVSGGPLQARGDYAAAYAEQIGELPDLLGKLGAAYRGCADALGRYAGALETAQSTSRLALQRGDDAFDRFCGARRQADALLPSDRALPWRCGPSACPRWWPRWVSARPMP